MSNDWLRNGALLQDTFWVTLVYSLDLVTFVVPPLLPATITAINVWAQQRLKKKKVYCLSSNYISQAGSVDLVCFDKVGWPRSCMVIKECTFIGMVTHRSLVVFPL